MENFEMLNEGELITINGGLGDQNCFVYVIKKGDCLSVIAQKYSTTVNELCVLNNIKNPDLIYAGNKILVPYKK